jgi:hypothetical protein
MRKKQLLELSKLAENELKNETKYIGWGVGREDGEQGPNLTLLQLLLLAFITPPATNPVVVPSSMRKTRETRVRDEREIQRGRDREREEGEARRTSAP